MLCHVQHLPTMNSYLCIFLCDLVRFLQVAALSRVLLAAPPSCQLCLIGAIPFMYAYLSYHVTLLIWAFP